MPKTLVLDEDSGVVTVRANGICVEVHADGSILADPYGGFYQKP